MYEPLRSFLFRLDPETAHGAASLAARFSQRATPFLLERMFEYAHPSLHQEVFGKTFTNPVGLAAGFDKNARMIPFWRAAGCGFVEIGSVTARKNKGNRRPRAFRLPEDQAIINRMGLGNDGARRIAPRIARHAGRPADPLGVNIAKTHDASIVGQAAIDDFLFSWQHVASFADYVALNISCPNTSEGKTFEDPNSLDDLLGAIMAQRAESDRRVPVLVKFSPPESERFVLDSLIDELVMVSLAHGVDGFIATNSASDRKGLNTDPERIAAIGAGGVSGRPIASRSSGLIRYLYQKMDGRLPIIGVGGIFSAEDALEKIRAGATLVQLYTGLVYKGPGLIRDIKQGLVRLMEEEGHSSISRLVGSEASRPVPA